MSHHPSLVSLCKGYRNKAVACSGDRDYVHDQSRRILASLPTQLLDEAKKGRSQLVVTGVDHPDVRCMVDTWLQGEGFSTGEINDGRHIELIIYW